MALMVVGPLFVVGPHGGGAVVCGWGMDLEGLAGRNRTRVVQ